jgi:hypothetical protein
MFGTTTCKIKMLFLKQKSLLLPWEKTLSFTPSLSLVLFVSRRSKIVAALERTRSSFLSTKEDRLLCIDPLHISTTLFFIEIVCRKLQVSMSQNLIRLPRIFLLSPILFLKSPIALLPLDGSAHNQLFTPKTKKQWQQQQPRNYEARNQHHNTTEMVALL